MLSAADRQSRRIHWTGSLPEYPAEGFDGDGIVICAGGASMFTNAYVLLHLLRKTLGCALPVEIWHLGPSELSPSMRSLLEELGAACVDGLEIATEPTGEPLDGWRLKALALTCSAFRNVLLLDADQAPTRAPDDVFDWPEFQRTGAVLWPDIIDLDEKNPIWDFCGLDPRRTPSIESGQLLFDKQRHWRGLQIALRLNANARDVYRLVYGDKDTFLLGLLLADEEFSLVPHRPAVDLGRCLHQHDFEGGVLFQHRTNAKWRYAGEQNELPGFQHRDACLHALQTLRRAWNGIVFTPPERSAGAQSAEGALIAAPCLTFLTPGQNPREIELLPHGEIGRGRAADCMNWHCAEEDGEIALILRDAFAPRWRLTQAGQGRWAGRSLIEPEVEAFAATGSFASQPPPERFAELWTQWPRPGHYAPRDDGQL